MDEPTREAVKRWLLLAEEDLEMAETVLAQSGITRGACFHSQQCVEKSLKAYLAMKQIDVERTHDLVKVLDECSKSDDAFLTLRDIANSLTIYAIAPRYPDDWREIPLLEAQQAVKMAKEVMDFVKEKLGNELFRA